MPLRRPRTPTDPTDPETVEELDEAVHHMWTSAIAALHAGDRERAQMFMQFIDELLDRRTQTKQGTQ